MLICLAKNVYPCICTNLNTSLQTRVFFAKYYYLPCSAPAIASVSQQINKKDAKLDQSSASKSYDIRVENFDVCFGDK